MFPPGPLLPFAWIKLPDCEVMRGADNVISPPTVAVCGADTLITAVAPTLIACVASITMLGAGKFDAVVDVLVFAVLTALFGPITMTAVGELAITLVLETEPDDALTGLLL